MMRLLSLALAIGLILALVVAGKAAPVTELYRFSTSTGHAIVTLAGATGKVVVKPLAKGSPGREMQMKDGRLELSADLLQGGECWIILNPDPKIDYRDGEPPRLVELVVDGEKLEYEEGLDLTGKSVAKVLLVYEDVNPLRPFEIEVAGVGVDERADGVSVQRQGKTRTALTLELGVIRVQPAQETEFPQVLRVTARDRGLDDEARVVSVTIGDLVPMDEKAVFLVDVKPEALKAYGGMRRTPRGADKPGYSLKGRYFAKSFATIPHKDRTPAEIIYDLTPYPDRRIFKAVVGLGDSTGSDGSVTFEVHVDDGEGKWRKLHETGRLKAGGDVKALCIDLGQKAQKLRLVVTVGGDSYSNDLGVWANVRLEGVK